MEESHVHALFDAQEPPGSAARLRAERKLPDVVALKAPDESLPGAPGMVGREEAGERVLPTSASRCTRPRRKAGGPLPDPAVGLHRARRTGRRQDADVGDDQGPAARRQGRPVARQRRVGTGLFGRKDRHQRRDGRLTQPQAAAAARRARALAARLVRRTDRVPAEVVSRRADRDHTDDGSVGAVGDGGGGSAQLIGRQRCPKARLADTNRSATNNDDIPIEESTANGFPR